jgi:replicative DNA helicase
MSDLQMPSHDIEIEEQVIGALMLSSKRAYDVCIDFLEAEDFYLELHQVAFRVAMDQIRETGHCDSVSVRREVCAALNSIPVEDITLSLMKIIETTASAANVAHHAKQVRAHAIRRKIASISTEIQDLVTIDDWSNDELLDLMDEKIDSIRQRSSLKNAPTQPTACFDDVVLEAGQTGGKTLATGLYTLDCLTGGFKPGDFVVVAARPSVGKTTMGLNIGVSMAVNKCRVVFVSLETSAKEILKTILSMKGGPFRWKFNPFWRGKLSPYDIDRARQINEELKSLDFVVADEKRFWRHPDRLAAEIRAMCGKRQVDLVVVDHFHLLNQKGHGRQRADQVMAETSQVLQNLAKDTGAVVLCLAQFNREIEKEHRQPRMSDIRECGKLEEDADIIVMLGYDHSRKEGFDYKQGHKNPFRIATIAKAKLAAGGNFRLKLDTNSMNFEDLDALSSMQEEGGGE